MVRVAKWLRREKVGGIIIMVAAAAGLIAANTGLSDWFFGLRDHKIGFESLGLKLSVGHWAADGLLAVFFFVVGLELKNEFVNGALRRFSTAIVPVAAAVGGVIVPALIYVAFNLQSGQLHGWAIPAATDIAFAVAVLGLIAPGVPMVLRMFLLTLAVVDDLIAIGIIAIFYTSDVNLMFLTLSFVPILIYGLLARVFQDWFARTAWAAWVVLLPIGAFAWALFYLSGVHATIAGVMLAFALPTDRRSQYNLAERLAFRFGPLSSGVAVPVFAFFSAGVAISADTDFPFNPVVYGVVLGLILGKPIGILLTTWLMTKFTGAALEDDFSFRELAGVASLAGVGFTVSLLISELSFSDPALQDTARLAVMAGSLLAVVMASLFLLRPRKKLPPVTVTG